MISRIEESGCGADSCTLKVKETRKYIFQLNISKATKSLIWVKLDGGEPILSKMLLCATFLIK